VLVGAVDPALLESDATFGAITVQDARVVAYWGATTMDLGSVDSLPGSGEHVRQNALMAIAAALALGAPLTAIETGLRAYRGVPHRFELVATIDGVAYINDSAATAPAAAVAAMRALAALRPVVIAGGSDKRLPLDPFADALAEHASAIVLLDGTATPALQALLNTRRVTNVHGPVGSMTAAVELAASAGAVRLRRGSLSRHRLVRSVP
jgi:UDP-N-acetylmuramoylalanine--D-glutamate ligase